LIEAQILGVQFYDFDTLFRHVRHIYSTVGHYHFLNFAEFQSSVFSQVKYW